MRARVVLGLVCLALIVLGSAAAPRAVQGGGCPRQPLTVAELRGLRGDDETLEFLGYVNRAGRRCYGSADLTIVGYVDSIPGAGWEGTWSLVPGWFAQPGLILYGDTNRADEHFRPVYYNLAWPGPYRELQERYLHRWVVVTAHFGDSRAKTCRAQQHIGDDAPSRAQLVRACRSILVVTAVRRLADSDTATAPGVGPVTGPVANAILLQRALLPLAAALGVLAWVGRRRLLR